MPDGLWPYANFLVTVVVGALSGILSRYFRPLSTKNHENAESAEKWASAEKAEAEAIRIIREELDNAFSQLRELRFANAALQSRIDDLEKRHEEYMAQTNSTLQQLVAHIDDLYGSIEQEAAEIKARIKGRLKTTRPNNPRS